MSMNCSWLDDGAEYNGSVGQDFDILDLNASICRHVHVSTNNTVANADALWMEMPICTVILAVTLLCGIIGNIHVIIIYAIYYKKTNFRLYVIVLSVTDLIGCTVSMAETLFRYHANFSWIVAWIQVTLMCIQSSTLLISMTVILTIGIDRSRRVMKPLGYQITYTEARLICTLVCIAAILLNVLSFVLLIGTVLSKSYDNSVLSPTISATRIAYSVLVCSIVIACLVVYIVMAIYMCIKLIKFGKHWCTCKYTVDGRSNISHQNVSSTNIDKIRATRYKKGTRKSFVFFVMALLSCLLLLPKFVTEIIVMSYTHLSESPFFRSRDQFFYIVYIFECMQYVNHCINPIVYGLIDFSFRQKCFELYSRCK